MLGNSKQLGGGLGVGAFNVQTVQAQAIELMHGLAVKRLRRNDFDANSSLSLCPPPHRLAQICA